MKGRVHLSVALTVIAATVGMAIWRLRRKADDETTTPLRRHKMLMSQEVV